ncbi:MAG: hypothetical protein WAM97_07975 [Acidimicrobiales bacterium]
MSSGGSQVPPEDGERRRTGSSQAATTRRHRWPTKPRHRKADKLGAEIRAYLDLTEDIHDMRPEDFPPEED